MKTRNYIGIGFMVILAVLGTSCNKSELVLPNESVTPFSFYPTADAMWIYKWREESPYYGYPYYLHIDTLYLDKDTMIMSSTDDPESPYYYDVEPPTLKGYQLIKGRGVTILPTGEKEYRSYRYTWFRADSIEEKFYTVGEHDGVVIEYLQYDFGVEVGDEIPYGQGHNTIDLIDSVVFGQHFLKRINHSNSWFDYSYIQGIDIKRTTWNVGPTEGPPNHSSYYEWIKFIHGTDTLVRYYE